MKEVKTGVPTFGTFFPKKSHPKEFHPESDDRNGLNSGHTLLLLLFVCTPAKQCECAETTHWLGMSYYANFFGA